MININATLLHDLLEIAVGTRVAQIEEHGIRDRFLWEMYALEVNRRSAPLVRHLCRKITAASPDSAKVKKFATEPMKVRMKPQMTKAATRTFLHEWQKADFRCEREIEG